MHDSLADQDIDPWNDWTPAGDPQLRGANTWNNRCPEDESLGNQTPLAAPSAAEVDALLQRLRHDSPPPTNNANSLGGEPSGASPTIDLEALDAELRAAFLDDASGCLEAMETAVLQLEADARDGEAMRAICRQLHTLKGASASVGLTDLADRLHQLEDQIRDDQAAGTATSVATLLHALDWVRSRLGDPAAVQGQAAAPASSAPSGPHRSAAGAAASTPLQVDQAGSDDQSVRVQSSQLTRLMDMLAELVMLRNQRQTEINDLQEIHRELTGSVAKLRQLGGEASRVVSPSDSAQLSEVAADLLEVAQRLRDCSRPVVDGNRAVSQFIRQFRQELVELQRAPVRGLLRRLQRDLRQTAVAEGKSVQMVLHGEGTGVDRSLQQRLYEPLSHIVRNAVCHGIEAAEQRRDRGKPPSGKITLEASSGSDLLIIQVRDDGGGLDYDAIRRRGVAAGLLAADQSAGEQELAQLIFHPGFSTRQTADRQAGRGVGMDVVAATLRRLRGWYQVESVPGRGTTIRLGIPLPSAIQHLMVFRSAGQLFAVPMAAVCQAGCPAEGIASLPFASLLGQHRGGDTAGRVALVLQCDLPGGSGQAGGRVNLCVDEIVGPEEVVVRPLPTLVRHHRYCAGATLAGSGQTVLVLDVRRLLQTHRQQLSLNAAPSGTATEADRQQTDRPRVLVVDDSLSSRTRVVRSLRRYPLSVVEAGDGRQALQLLRSGRFDAVFSDLEMPHVDGLELLAELRWSEAGSQIPVTMISSRNEPEFVSKATELGVTAYLIKPVSDEALDAAMAAVESLAHLRPTSPLEPTTRN